MVQHRIQSELSRERRESGAWFLISVALHGLLLAAVIFLTPVRQVLFEQQPPEMAEPALTSDAIEQLDEHIQEKTEQQLEQNLEQQERILEELQQIREEKREQFEQFEQEAAKTADEEALAEIVKAIEAMKQAEQKLRDDPLNAEALTLQREAQDHQDRANEKMKQSMLDVAEARRAHQEASELHREAMEQVEAARSEKREAEQTAKGLQRTQRLVRNMESRVNKVKEQLAHHRRERDSEAAKAKEFADQKQQAQAEDNASREEYYEKQIERAEKEIEKREAEISDREQKLPALEAELKQLKDKQAELEAQSEVLTRRQQEEAEDSPASKQAAAAEAQAKAAKALQDAITGGKQAVADATEEAPDAEQMDAQTVAEKYEKARALETQTAETFKELKAMEVAMIRDVSLNSAMDAVDVAKAERPDLDSEATTETARTNSALEKRKQQAAVALRETSSMVAFGNMLLSQALRQQMADTQGREMAIATEGDGWVAEQRAEQARAAHAASGRVADMTGRSGHQGAAEPSRQPPPDLDKRIRPASFQRVVTTQDANVTGWVALRSWYIIGPYDNRGRINRDRVFLPETVVDLGAVYAGEGMDGQDLRWRYTLCTSPGGECMPESWRSWAVYYAYREIECEQPVDVWCAMGSDDKGKVWVNGQLIWVSADHHKSWSPGEALRKVRLKKGRNRILFRIENGQLGMGFSFMLHIDPNTLDLVR